jgi:hypothetical protein
MYFQAIKYMENLPYYRAATATEPARYAVRKADYLNLIVTEGQVFVKSPENYALGYRRDYQSEWKPLWHWYDDDLEARMKWEIKYAREAGLSYFAYQWNRDTTLNGYGPDVRPFMNQALDTWLQNIVGPNFCKWQTRWSCPVSPVWYKDFQFAVDWAETTGLMLGRRKAGDPDDMTLANDPRVQELHDLYQFWAAHYFTRANYLRDAAGRPVFYLAFPFQFVNPVEPSLFNTPAELGQALGYLRQWAAADHFGSGADGLNVVCVAAFRPLANTDYTEETYELTKYMDKKGGYGCDAVTLYMNYVGTIDVAEDYPYAPGKDKKFTSDAGFGSAAGGIMKVQLDRLQRMNQAAIAAGGAAVPVVTQMWDERPQNSFRPEIQGVPPSYEEANSMLAKTPVQCRSNPDDAYNPADMVHGPNRGKYPLNSKENKCYPNPWAVWELKKDHYRVLASAMRARVHKGDWRGLLCAAHRPLALVHNFGEYAEGHALGPFGLGITPGTDPNTDRDEQLDDFRYFAALREALGGAPLLFQEQEPGPADVHAFEQNFSCSYEHRVQSAAEGFDYTACPNGVSLTTPDSVRWVDLSAYETPAGDTHFDVPSERGRTFELELRNTGSQAWAAKPGVELGYQTVDPGQAAACSDVPAGNWAVARLTADVPSNGTTTVTFGVEGTPGLSGPVEKALVLCLRRPGGDPFAETASFPVLMVP